MNTLLDIPGAPNQRDLLKTLRLESGSADAMAFQSLFEKARAVAAPKAAFRECFIERKTDDSVIIDGLSLSSRVLRRNIGDAQRVFPFVATCGTELDAIEINQKDFLSEYWLDTIKGAWLKIALDRMSQHIQELHPFVKTTSMSPGSGDIDVWPIEDQRHLFDILGDVESAIGVRLTGEMLMLPNKTISGIRYPSEHDFRTCVMCHRENCPSRKAPPADGEWSGDQSSRPSCATSD